MWFIRHCLAFHGTCQPQNWADLGELTAGAFLLLGAWLAFCIALVTRG